MTTPTRSKIVSDLSMLASGIDAHAPDYAFTFSSETFDKASLVAKIRTICAASQRVIAAQGELGDALAEEQKVRAAGAAFIRNVQATFISMFSNQSNVLADLALAPVRRRPPPTNEELVKRVIKAAATRKKRRTMGKRQRAAIKGTVSGVVVTAVTSGGRKSSK